MKKTLLAIGLLTITLLGGCAVVPAYGPAAYYEPAPYYEPRYYGPSATVIVPAPVFGHRHRNYGGRRW